MTLLARARGIVAAPDEGKRVVRRVMPARRVSATRLAWLDWLRVLAVIAILGAHAGQVFMPWADWFITNDTRSRAVGLAVFVVGPWLLPLLMLLAGFAGQHSLRRRTNGEFLWDRTRRVLIPFIAGMLVLVPPQVYIERRFHGDFDGSLLSFYQSFFTDGLYPEGNFALRHMWFLAHLFVYSAVALPLFRYWSRAAARERLDRVATRLGERTGWIWLALPLIAERHITWAVLTRLGWRLEDWTSQTALLLAFVYGFALAASPPLMRLIDARWRDALRVALVFTAALLALAWNGFIPARLPPSSTVAALAFWTAYTFGAWAWTVAVLGFGRRHLTVDTRFLAYARRDAYAWYLLHQTVIVALAAWVVTWPTGLMPKFGGLVISSAAVTAAGAALLNRLKTRRS
jgi:peptidoglycan/LPS O-acetylase OafA/YrhL